QYFGAGRKADVHDAIHTAYAFALVGGVILTVLGIAFSTPLLSIMNTPEDIFADSDIYLKIYFMSLVFMFVYNIGSGILRALGNSRTPLHFLIACSLINIVLDFVFVLGLGLGVTGVAIATFLSQLISAIAITVYLMKDENCQLDLRKIRFKRNILANQLKIGIPGGIQSTMYSLSNIIVQTAVNAYGTMVMAGWASDVKIESIFWLLENSLGIAITTFVGQNYGAGKKDRIIKGTRICLVMFIMMAVTISVLFAIFRYPLIGLFTSNEEAIEVGAQMIIYITPFYFLFAFVEVLSGTLRGMGDVFIPTIITMVCVCAVRVLWVLFVAPLFPGLICLEILYPITWGTASVAFIIYYLARKRKWA
nr:MATE family efflux transporter [Lachnospiraceae bacterium]